ncbi:zinc finger MYM-type protein 1-like [Zingiber officinale]|uniref:zinc finger MYM-type protein 1-like n=1 Tax=Zingiber officinale TaxID=94328 RepID=UPI001C4D0D3E|nr:zinc finger MYM-type protein 1-like [Zingiber officinale]
MTKSEKPRRAERAKETSIRAVRWLALQRCAFRGHDETVDSHNRGNFIELVKFQGELCKEIGDIILDRAAKNAKYISPSIQQEILKIIADLMRIKIRDEVGDAKFCILVDEAVDKSHRSQMAIVLRYLDCDGFVRERFFELVGVDDTNALTLKTHICNILTQHKLLIENMRGQGYDGASNMRGEWNGLQALFLKDCRFAYYIHYFAHRLQLTLVVAAKEVSDRHSQLKSIRGNEIIDLIKSGELGTGTGVNQASTLQRPASTCWSSHYTSIIRVIELFGSICTLLEDLIGGKLTFGIRAEAKGLLKVMMTFDFVFILLLMHRVLETSDMLCQALQRKNQDILNAMSLVATTKLLFQKMRDDEWDDFLWSVNNFCDTHDIVVPDLTDHYIKGTKRSCQQKNQFTVEEFYHFHIFNVVIDKQLMELNTRFTEESIELLTLCEALNPSDGFKSFSESAIYSLIEKFYPSDFSKDDMKHLKTQLDHYKLDPSYRKTSLVKESPVNPHPSRRRRIIPKLHRLRLRSRPRPPPSLRLPLPQTTRGTSNAWARWPTIGDHPPHHLRRASADHTERVFLYAAGTCLACLSLVTSVGLIYYSVLSHPGTQLAKVQERVMGFSAVNPVLTVIFRLALIPIPLFLKIMAPIILLTGILLLSIYLTDKIKVT